MHRFFMCTKWKTNECSKKHSILRAIFTQVYTYIYTDFLNLPLMFSFFIVFSLNVYSSSFMQLAVKKTAFVYLCSG